MPYREPDSPADTDQRTKIQNSDAPLSIPSGSELFRSVPDDAGPPPPKIADSRDKQASFSPSEDTVSAIDDLGLHLVAVADKNVIGQMAHYDIIRCLGRGGMGTVFEAFDTKLYRPVAIKFMASSLAASSKARSRFLREARVAASINHPNVVTIHSVDEHDGRPYLVMEFVSGITLQDQVRNLGTLSVGDVLRISRQIATGLRAAHEKGIVHRDIKPGNVLLENGVQRVKIVDFGLAQVVFEMSDITSQGQTLGTPRYMAPEQIEGSRVDERADLFSFGCVIYMMCVGQPPFSGNAFTVLHNILREKHVPIRQVMPQMPQALSDLVDRMLSKSLDTRIQTAAEVESALMEIARAGTPSDDRLPIPHRHHVAANIPSPPVARRRPKIAMAIGLMTAAAATLWAVWPLSDVTRPGLNENSVDATGNSAATSRVTVRSNPVVISPADINGMPEKAPEAPLVKRDPKTFTVGAADSDFSSLATALLQVQAGDTLSVAGELPANDTLLLNNPDRHANLTIDWADNVLLTTSGGEAAITIDSVPGVKIRHAHVFVQQTHAVSIRGNCPGLLLENCNIEQAAGSRQAVVALWETARGTENAPVVFKSCHITFFELGIACLGTAKSPVEWVSFEDNICYGLQTRWGTAFVLENSVRHLDFVRNRIANVRAGISVPGVWDHTRLANNSFFEVIGPIQTSQASSAVAVSVLSNLAVKCNEFAPAISSGNPELTFVFNKVDSAGQSGAFESIRDVEFVSTDAHSPDFLTPWANEQLMIAASPKYAGAMEPRMHPPEPVANN